MENMSMDQSKLDCSNSRFWIESIGPHPNLYKAKLIQTLESWRCQNGEDRLTHMLWSCQKIQNFWSEIHEKCYRNHRAWCAFFPRGCIFWGACLFEDLLFHETALMLEYKCIISEWNLFIVWLFLFVCWIEHWGCFNINTVDCSDIIRKYQ